MKRPALAWHLPFGLALLLTITLAAWGGGTSRVTLPTFYPGDTAVPTSGPDVPGVSAYDQKVTALLKKWNIPGAAIAVAKDGKLILARGYGYADFEAKQLMQPDSMFRIGSTSKVLTSMAILHLKDQGHVDLDEKFLDILTQYQVATGSDPRLRTITIHNLLQHSGGWDRDKTGDPMGWQGTISKARSKPMLVLCPDVIQYMMGQPLDFAPGTKQVYSNLGYCILGRVVEKVSGEPCEIYVREHVLASMDVYALSIGYGHLSQRGPKYYDYEGTPLVDSVFRGEGKMPSAYALEVLTLDACGGCRVARGSHAGDDRDRRARIVPFLKPETRTEYTADPGLPDWNSNQNYWYGLGIFVGPTPETWYHGGTIAGAQSELLRDGTGYTWVIITNSLSQDRRVWVAIWMRP